MSLPLEAAPKVDVPGKIRLKPPSGLTDCRPRGLLLAVDCSTCPSRERPTPPSSRAGTKPRPRSKWSATLGAATLTLLAAGAAAAVASTRSKAEEALHAVSGNPKAAQVARVQVAKARDALDRGGKARQAGDAPHADLLDELALEWAGAAVDLARAAELESRAAKIEKEAAEVEARAKRALSLIEQTVARRGKAVERLRELGVEPGEDTPPTPAPNPEQPNPKQPSPEKPIAGEVKK